MRLWNYAVVTLIAAAQLAGTSVSAQQMATASMKPDCLPEAPDSLQISWTRPCYEADWLLDTETGCRMGDWHPDPKDRAIWSGACPGGKREGNGVVQWYEHGQAVDRFEGIFRTVTLMGESLSGIWKNGCLAAKSRVVAIGVERSSCARTRTAEGDRGAI